MKSSDLKDRGVKRYSVMYGEAVNQQEAQDKTSTYIHVVSDSNLRSINPLLQGQFSIPIVRSRSDTPISGIHRRLFLFATTDDASGIQSCLITRKSQ